MNDMPSLSDEYLSKMAAVHDPAAGHKVQQHRELDSILGVIKTKPLAAANLAEARAKVGQLETALASAKSRHFSEYPQGVSNTDQRASWSGVYSIEVGLKEARERVVALETQRRSIELHTAAAENPAAQRTFEVTFPDNRKTTHPARSASEAAYKRRHSHRRVFSWRRYAAGRPVAARPPRSSRSACIGTSPPSGKGKQWTRSGKPPKLRASHMQKR